MNLETGPTKESPSQRRVWRTRPTPKKPEKPLSRTQLASLLQNPYYVGVVRYAGVEYEGRHEHLIDQHTLAKAKAVLAAHASSAEKDRKHHHYLKGSLYCGRCGSRMSFTYARGNGGGYAYFYCLGRTRGTGCEQPCVPVDLIETAVENAYGDVRLPRKQTERVRGKLSHALGGMREQAEADATCRRKRLAKLTEEREKLLHAYYAGPSPPTFCAKSRTGSPPRLTRPSARSKSPRRPSPISRTPSARHSICSPIASAPTWLHLGIYGGNGTRRSSSGWWSTPTRSVRPRSPSLLPRSPTRNCPRSLMERLSPPAPFLLALVRVRPFQWGGKDSNLRPTDYESARKPSVEPNRA
jgi:Recombinase zinc beta ribbon domain